MLCHEWFNLIIIGCFPLLLQTKRRLAGLTLPGIARLFSTSNQGKILDLPGRWWCREDSDELLPCAMTSGGNVGNFIIQSSPPPFSPESDLFWQRGGGSRWFRVTFIDIKSPLSHLVLRYFACTEILLSIFLLEKQKHLQWHSVHEHAKETLGSVRSADTNHPNVGL